MSIYYTGKGDDGASRVGLKKIAKTNLVMSALGDLDELNSLLGIIKNHFVTNKRRSFNEYKLLHTISFLKILERAQENLFIIQAHVASGMFEKSYKLPNFSKEKVIELENIIAKCEKQLKSVNKFVVPGTNEKSAWLDYARTIARRAERSILKFSKKEKVTPEILAYLNRLSSLFFVMARVTAKNRKEKSPKYI